MTNSFEVNSTFFGPGALIVAYEQKSCNVACRLWLLDVSLRKVLNFRFF